MLHEVLLALVGHTGDVVVSTTDGRFAVCEGATFLHASERALVERVVRVGAAYAAVASFVRVCARESARDDVVDADAADGAGTGDGALAHVRGLYVRALCGGLDELLDGYRQRVSQLEQAALTDPTITLASCEHYLDDFAVVLPNVASLCATVQRTSSMSGGALLNALHEATLTGAPVLRTCFERLLFHCHKVFFDMMQSWMAYGKLYDPHGEFFVALQVDEAASDETLWLSKHAIVPANIPQYLTSKMASAVLFVGKAMQVLRHAEAARFGVACEQQTDSIRQVLREIQASPSFHPLTFEISVQQIRSSIAAELWRLVVNGAQLEQHLLMLKDFFLLAKGDVFQTFVEENAAMFREPPTSTADRQIGQLFAQAVSKSVPDDDPRAHAFTMHYDPNFGIAGSVEARPDAHRRVWGGTTDQWCGLYLKYAMRFPIDLLVSPDVLRRYNELFKFLFSVKRAEISLHIAWTKLMSSRRLQLSELQRMQPVMQLRQLMGFFIDNLQYYLQADVLDSQWTRLVERIRESQNFEAIHAAHDEYLSTLTRHCFLYTQKISPKLEQMLELCLKFGALLNTLDPRELPAQRVADLRADFERNAKVLFMLLGNVTQLQEAPYLAQFLLRLDYNKYFSELCKSVPSVASSSSLL